MKIVGFLGQPGEGKTLSMVSLANVEIQAELRQVSSGLKKQDEVKNIVSNVHLTENFGPWRELKFPHIKKGQKIPWQEESNASFLWDEIDVWADALDFGTDKNKLLSYFVKQCRKRRVNMYWTSQTFMRVYNRIRDLTNYLVRCKAYEGPNGLFILQDVYKAPFYDGMPLHVQRIIPAHRCKQVFEMYDTDQMIFPEDWSSAIIEEKEREKLAGKVKARKVDTEPCDV